MSVVLSTCELDEERRFAREVLQESHALGTVQFPLDAPHVGEEQVAAVRIDQRLDQFAAVRRQVGVVRPVVERGRPGRERRWPGRRFRGSCSRRRRAWRDRRARGRGRSSRLGRTTVFPVAGSNSICACSFSHNALEMPLSRSNSPAGATLMPEKCQTTWESSAGAVSGMNSNGGAIMIGTVINWPQGFAGVLLRRRRGQRAGRRALPPPEVREDGAGHQPTDDQENRQADKPLSDQRMCRCMKMQRSRRRRRGRARSTRPRS